MAKLYFRYGAMNCGKSTRLLQEAYNYKERDQKVLLLKPAKDSKGDRKIVSRLGAQQDVDFLIYPNDLISKKLESILTKGDRKCLFIDESQFLSPSQVDELFYITIEKSIPVICYGIRTDFLMKGFPGSTRLLEIAHSLDELKTICRCGIKAICNTRKIEGKFIFSGQQVAIDGEKSVSYESLCGKCYFEELARSTDS